VSHDSLLPKRLAKTSCRSDYVLGLDVRTLVRTVARLVPTVRTSVRTAVRALRVRRDGRGRLLDCVAVALFEQLAHAVDKGLGPLDRDYDYGVICICEVALLP
jgi:hypothetical protein